MIFGRKKELEKLKVQNLLLQKENAKLKVENNELRKRLRSCSEVYISSHDKLAVILDEFLEANEYGKSEAQKEIDNIKHGILLKIKKEG